MGVASSKKRMPSPSRINAEEDRAAPGKPARRHSSFWPVFGVAMIGSVLLWLSFPPVGLWPLAWLAPAPWLYLTGRAEPLGRKDYGALWLAAFCFWAALLFGIALAHVALIGGWLVLAAYVAAYLPLSVGMTRMLVHRFHWPFVLAAPVAWVGLEYLRAYFATGFSVAMMANTQIEFPLILQIADLFGAYGPSFVMLVVSAALTMWFIPASKRSRLISNALSVTLIAASLGYGAYRMSYQPPQGPQAKIMLVQGCVDTVLDGNPDRPIEMDKHYRELTFDNLSKHPPCDLVVWPESAFVYPDYAAEQLEHLPEQFSPEDYHESQERYSLMLTHIADRLNEATPQKTSFLVGGNSLRFEADGMKVYNAALLISPEGKLSSRYFKNHLVMFGEYIPFGELLPFIYSVTPIQPLSRGREFSSFEVAGVTFSPNICFESTVPQLVRRQVNDLASKGSEPDVLVNTTNDGWFYGSGILDLHFQCAVLRSIENRKPYAIAANTGISGVIDGSGRILQRGPSHATDILVADVSPDGRTSLFRTLGDWPAAGCFALTLAVCLWGVFFRRKENA